MYEELLLLLVMGLVGGYLMFDAVKRFKQYRAIKDTPTTTIRAASLGDGEIKGTAKSPQDANLIETPITGQESLFTKYELQKKKHAGEWIAFSSGVYGIPFVVEDETGALFVNPSYNEYEAAGESFSGSFLSKLRAELSEKDTGFGFPPDFEIDIEPTESEEDRRERMKFKQEDVEKDSPLGRFLDRTDLTRHIESDSIMEEKFEMVEDEFRIMEKDYLCPGDDVYLLGNLESPHMTDTEIDNDYDMTVRNANGQSGMFLISNQDEEELLAERRRYPFKVFPVGALIFSASIVFLLMYMGIL